MFRRALCINPIMNKDEISMFIGTFCRFTLSLTLNKPVKSPKTSPITELDPMLYPKELQDPTKNKY